MSIKSKFVQWFLEGKMPKFFYRFAGRKIGDKLAKEEIIMDETKSKWKSRTVWIAIIGVILGAIQPISSALGMPVVVPTWVYEVLAAAGLYTLRTSTQDVK